MATASDRTDSTEQLQRFINNLWQHQQANEFCDFTLTTNDTSIECHKLVLSSASSYFSQLLGDSEHTTNIINVTPLSVHTLRTVVAFMYNSEYVIDDENVLELLKLSRTWNLDILVKLCATYIHVNITINNACRFYNFALEDVHVDLQVSEMLNEFIREHYTSLYESGQLSELSPKNLLTILEHDEINVKNEDVIFSSTVKIINQQTSVEDINRCLELIRFPHTSRNFLVEVILGHPLMSEPPRDRYVKEALLYQVNKLSTPEVKPRRHWCRAIYYIGKNNCMYEIASNAPNNTSRKILDVPGWVDDFSSIALYGESLVILGGQQDRVGDKRVLLVDMANCTNVSEPPDVATSLADALTSLPDLPEPLYDAGVVLLHNDLYVIGGGNANGNNSNSIYYLSLGNYKWQTRKSMSDAISCPLVVQHRRCIYVLGGYQSDVGQIRSSVSRYCIEEDTWKRCRDMPISCHSDTAGVVVHEDRIKVITVDNFLTYAEDTDTWVVKQYNIPLHGDGVKVFVKRGQIWAAVENGDTLGIVSYDGVDNVWKTELKSVDNAWYTTLFC